jgi:SAM-dependent methyltransferase
MSRLTQKTHWDSVHHYEQEHFFPSGVVTESTHDVPLKAKAVRSIKRLLGPGVLERMTAYDDYLLWKVILPKYVPRMPGGKVVEIGSAPGDYVVAFAKHHGCIPHGIEYSEVGVELNRRVFARHGFNPDNVIHSDFFSEDFRHRYREQFDAVISKGFIEHFDDLRPVIDGHFELLKPGGYMVVTIPNLRGLNYPVIRLLDEEAIPRHNIEIMRKKVYASLFERKDLQPLFCDYYGTFSFYLYTAGKSQLQRRALRTAYKLQPMLNLGFRTFLGSRGLESGALSPFLLYIGRKT